MRKRIIKQAQAYLIVKDECSKRKIVDMKKLLKRHSLHEVVSYMEALYAEKQKHLQDLIGGDKTRSEINDVVSTLFRLHMSLSLLKDSATADREAA